MPMEPTKKLWMNDSCLVCTSVHSSNFEKIHHEGEIAHQKKAIVYDFLKKQLPNLGKVNPESGDALSSKLYERYIRAGAPIMGLDCIIELSVHWATTPMWICKLCYAAGKDLESADAHLYSSFHKRNYLSDKYPDRFENLICIQEKNEVHTHTAIEQEATLDVLHQLKGISSPPQLYVLGINKWDRDQVEKDLALDKDFYEKSYVVEPTTSRHQIMSCHICGETIMSFMDEEERTRLWAVHCSTPKHQKFQMIHSAIAEVRTIERNEQPRNFSISHDFNFHEENGIFYGPTCGMDFLTTFESECFCKLCCCIIPLEDASKHFRMDTHIFRFLNRYHPSKLLNIEHNSLIERNTLFSILLKNEHLDPKYSEAQQKLPIQLRSLALPENRKIETGCKSQKIGNFEAFWCQSCMQYFKEDELDSKRTHLYSMEHFDRVVKRGFFNLEEDFYINKFFKMPPILCPVKGRFQLNMTTQNHCFYGLEFVVKDEISKRFVCKCCVTSFKEGKLEDLGVHLRSYGHAIRALHSINPSMISFLWRCIDPSQENEVILDYLKHTPINSDDKIRMYDPILAVSLNCQASIPKKFLQMTYTEPSERKALIGSERLAGCVGLNAALNTTHLEILEITKKLIKFYCNDCSQAFTCFLDKLENVWFDHLFTRSHWHRSNMLKVNRLSTNNFDDRPSPFFVPAYEQDSGKKKVTWKWSDQTRAYEFAYMRLGLKDIAHRYGPSGDFFCTICAKNLPLDQNLLERHVRSLEHVFFYVHKYFPLSIPDLEDILYEKQPSIAAKRKSLRRYIARVFKEVEEKLDAIPIYNLKRLPCEFESVEVAVDFDEFAIETETMEKQIEKTTKPVWHFMLPCVGDIKMDKTNYDKVNLDLSEESSGQKMTLEGEKLKLINEAKYNELENGANSKTAFAMLDDIRQEHLKSLSIDDRSRSRSKDKYSDKYSTYKEKKKEKSHRSRKTHPSRTRSRSRDRLDSYKAYSSHYYQSQSPGRHHSRSPRRHRSRSRSPRKYSNDSSSRDPYNYGFTVPAFSKGSAQIPSYDNDKHPSLSKSAKPEVSFNTSNKDPAWVRARIFVGFGLKSEISRDEIIQLFCTYGKLLGCSCYKGYSFIQFSNSSEADLAVSALNGYYFKGSILDVKLAVSSMKASSEDHYKAIMECQKLTQQEPSLPGYSSKNLRSRSHSIESVSSGGSEFERIAKSKKPVIDSEEKKSAKIQINLLNRLAKNKESKKDRSPSPTPGEFKIRHSPDTVKTPSLQNDSDDEPLALRKLKNLSAMLKPKIDDLGPGQLTNPTLSNIPTNTINLMPQQFPRPPSTSQFVQPPVWPPAEDLQPKLVYDTTLKFDLTKPPIFPPPPTLSIIPDFSKPPPMLGASGMLGQTPPRMIHAQGIGIPPGLGVPPIPGAAGALGPWNVNPIPPPMTQQQLVLKAKMELYKRDLAKINSKEDLIKYLKDQGSDKIPDADPPLLFNEIVKTKKGILGADSLYQIICYGYQDLETYYCHMCDYWTTVSEIFSHLNASMHRLKYMFRSYKVYHKKAMDEPDEDARDAMLQKFAEHIWKIEGSGECKNRMRCILNAEDIQRIWPDSKNYVDNSWKLPDLEEEKPAEPIRPPVNEPISAKAFEPQTPKKTPEKPVAVEQPKSEEKDLRLAEFLARMQSTLSEKPKEDERERRHLEEEYYLRRRQRSPSPRRSPHREIRRSPPRETRSRDSRERNRQYDPYGREPPKRRREDSPDTTWKRSELSRPTTHSKSPEIQYSTKKDDAKDWEKKAAAFLDKIGEKDAAAKFISQRLKNEFPSNNQMDDTPPGVFEKDDLFGKRYGQSQSQSQYETDRFPYERDRPIRPETWGAPSGGPTGNRIYQEEGQYDKYGREISGQDHYGRENPAYSSQDRYGREPILGRNSYFQENAHDPYRPVEPMDQDLRFGKKPMGQEKYGRDPQFQFEKERYSRESQLQDRYGPPPAREIPHAREPPIQNSSAQGAQAQDNSDLLNILSSMGMSSDEVLRILQQAKPGSSGGGLKPPGQQTTLQQQNANQTQPSGRSPTINKPPEPVRPIREYRRLVPTNPEATAPGNNTRAHVVREDGFNRNTPPVGGSQLKMIPLDTGRPKPMPMSQPNQPNYNDPWKS